MRTDSYFRSLLTQFKNPNYRIRNRAAYALAKRGDIRALEPLLEALGDFDPADESSKVNMCASSALCELNGPVLDRLIAVLNERRATPKDGWRRYWVAQTLGFFDDSRSIHALIDVLADPDREVVEGAANALGRIGDAQALPALDALLQQQPFPSKWSVYTAITNAITNIRARETNM